ncbi:hypothetical protein SLS58_011186, partial [Diplodia intermedia]
YAHRLRRRRRALRGPAHPPSPNQLHRPSPAPRHPPAHQRDRVGAPDAQGLPQPRRPRLRHRGRPAAHADARARPGRRRPGAARQARPLQHHPLARPLLRGQLRPRRRGRHPPQLPRLQGRVHAPEQGARQLPVRGRRQPVRSQGQGDERAGYGERHRRAGRWRRRGL